MLKYGESHGIYCTGVGIDARFQESDQRYWMVKCSHCGYWQTLNFKDNIKIVEPDLINRMAKEVKPGATAYVCAKCGKNIDSDRWYNCEWVPKFRDVDSRGYRISQMNAVWIPADKIYSDYLQTSSQWFYNYTLGTPQTDEALKINRGDIFKLRKEFLPTPRTNREGYAYVSAGIDWGVEYHHIVILGMTPSGRWDVIRLIRVPASKGIENIEADIRQVIYNLSQYQPDIICPDLGYSGPYVDILTKNFGKGVVYGVKTRTARSNGDYKAHFNENDSSVTIDKLMQNMLLMSHVKAQRICVYNKVDEDLDILATHAENVVIRDVDDEDGTSHKEITRKGGDHYFQSLVYAMVGMNHIVEVLRDSGSSMLEVSDLDISGNRDSTRSTIDKIKENASNDFFNPETID